MTFLMKIRKKNGVKKVGISSLRGETLAIGHMFDITRLWTKWLYQLSLKLFK